MKYIKEFESFYVFEKICDLTCVVCSEKTKTFTLGKSYELIGKWVYNYKYDSYKVKNDKGRWVYLSRWDIEKKDYSFKSDEYITGNRAVLFSKDSLEDWLLKVDIKKYNL